jgi:hypothetical protein
MKEGPKDRGMRRSRKRDGDSVSGGSSHLSVHVSEIFSSERAVSRTASPAALNRFAKSSRMPSQGLSPISLGSTTCGCDLPSKSFLPKTAPAVKLRSR